MRANLMVYRDMRDPWLRRMRSAPVEALLELMPGLGKLLGDFAVPGFVKIRPADLYVTKGFAKPGIVLVGDAFATSCPAAGTGTGKVFTDVERLCNVHIPALARQPPAWAATRSRPFTPIPSSAPRTRPRSTRPIGFAPSPPNPAFPGGRCDGRGLPSAWSARPAAAPPSVADRRGGRASADVKRRAKGVCDVRF